MPKDFTPSRRRPKKKTNPRRPTRNKPTNVFLHAPSFVAGLVAGVTLFLLGAYAPEWLADDTGPAVSQAAPEKPKLTFEFPDLLKNSEVSTDPEVYQPDLIEEGDGVPSEFLIQAASFRHPDDAETLRAQLLLQDLPVTMGRVALTSGAWYRVTVGPYETQTEALRTLTKLREQDLNAILLKSQIEG